MATVTGRSYTFTGLSVATSYNFEVLAINEQGIAPNNHAAQLTATASGGMYSSQMEMSVSVSLFLLRTPPLQSLAVPNPPTLRVVLPRFSNTYLVWRDPKPFVGAIIGVQIHYLIDCIPQNISELSSGVRQFSASRAVWERHTTSA